MGTFVVFENDGWKSSTVTIATTGNVKVASSNVKPQVLEAIQQQNESSLSQFYLVGNAVMGKLTTQVQPGSVGERCWAGATLLASEAESFLMDIEELLDPASYQTELSEADQQALEDAVLNM